MAGAKWAKALASTLMTLYLTLPEWAITPEVTLGFNTITVRPLQHLLSPCIQACKGQHCLRLVIAACLSAACSAPVAACMAVRWECNSVMQDVDDEQILPIHAASDTHAKDNKPIIT